MSLYLFRNESVQGPYTEAEIQDLLKHGEILPLGKHGRAE